MVKVNNTKTATPEKAPREASLFLDSLNSYASLKKNVYQVLERNLGDFSLN